MKTLLLSPIKLENEHNNEGIRIAMSGTNGEFIIINNINSADLWIMTDKKAIKKIF